MNVNSLVPSTPPLPKNKALKTPSCKLAYNYHLCFLALLEKICAFWNYSSDQRNNMLPIKTSLSAE